MRCLVRSFHAVRKRARPNLALGTRRRAPSLRGMRELLLDLFIIGTYFVIIVMPVIEFPWRIMAGT